MRALEHTLQEAHAKSFSMVVHHQASIGKAHHDIGEEFERIKIYTVTMMWDYGSEDSNQAKGKIGSKNSFTEVKAILKK